MAAKQNVPRRHRSPAEKRRIVELTLRAGASLRAIAREHGLHPNSLRKWTVLYRAGKLDEPAPRAQALAPSATFVPVRLVPTARKPPPPMRPDTGACGSGVLQIAFTSGATLRIETGAVDAVLVCALVAELRR
jgi:transposase-like protein